ncbi:ATP-grasp domain-containing protein [Frankia sp. CNm7]|uniref:ATP-grasp domain-containing protein n=1 Tax=Frankia nepalensis TaxID=1836974 RepID=A0A937RRJ3_9ACTN|nr:biotin carboxylase N-terminal domain-containing protein [Frankia nepalensis]MBL7502366.1 ATP-grasp domain-containing protein [Frankia nepalensis]MBL7514241.1 ATP-grasp domain-containing protein [Frankia nepalensis]MBL7521835.1 ATP-grasp domain-containing protein [Frankia nepalensis]MBL7633640.1 ATP-grasp domain-containing protein [Frankia nepalensis]
MRKILIANRGEIAVRVARASKDAGYTSVAVYAEPDIDALHVRVADEAYALGGSTPGDSYLRIDKILDVAAKSGADAVHPGYGFLSENADFAEAVIAAGLTWIGPPPDAIRRLGDKTAARHIALAVGAPLAPGTADPVAGVDEVVAFAEEHGLPVAIKAAFGGGGRGLKVAWTKDELAELFDSAVREAVAAFGRGECFVERYLDQPRHVETQILADTHGNVVVVGTRDCSLQRRYQKLVEEAPAPFLTEAQVASLYEASKKIAKEAGYVGAGTCEFLVAKDGMISFLEVNTRLQVEHPVTEETTGIDLVREQFRIAEGEALGFTDPPARGHSIEFRINGEDPGRKFLPAPGTVTRLVLPTGPGVRVDTGIESGSVIGGAFDSLLAKVIITGATRQQALERARRALDELIVDGMATALPFHRAVVRDPAFAPDTADEAFTVHNRWIETEFVNTIPAFTGGAEDEAGEAGARETVVVEVGGKRLEVVLPAGLGAVGGAAGGGARGAAPKRKASTKKAGGATGNSLTSPMQGTIVKVAVADGDAVAEGDLIVVLEAMKMEQPITAHRAGTITGLSATVGAVVPSGTVLCEIKD